MTLDETIEWCESASTISWNGKPTKTAKEYSQLAEWLKDYKRLLGAIEDIKAEICEEAWDSNYGEEIVKDMVVDLTDALTIIDKHISGKEQKS